MRQLKPAGASWAEAWPRNTFVGAVDFVVEHCDAVGDVGGNLPRPRGCGW